MKSAPQPSPAALVRLRMPKLGDFVRQFHWAATVTADRHLEQTDRSPGASRESAARRQKDAVTIASRPPPPYRNPRHRAAFSYLLVLDVVHALHGVAHVFVRLTHVISLLLLFWRQQRSDLRHRVIHNRLRLLHRVLVNCDQLRFRLIEDRLNLGLLIGGKF